MLGYLVLRALSWLAAALPLRAALGLARGLAAVGFHVVRFRRWTVLDNLRHALGRERSESDLHAIAAEAYRQTAMTFIEVLRASSPGSEDLVERVGYDPLDRFVDLKAKGTPVIIIQGHFGNFDLAAYAFAVRGFPLHTVMKGVKNWRVERFLVATRERHAITVHVKEDGIYEALLAALQCGEWLGLLPDQRARKRGVTVDFLGRPATIFPGPARLHLATGAPIAVALSIRDAQDPTRHHVRFRFLEPRAPSGDEASDIHAVLQAIADTLAAAIREHPGHYFWFHRLWGKSED